MAVPTQINDDALLQQELQQLDEELVPLGNQMVKPSTCYRFTGNPRHILYNTNCPDKLMEKIDIILSKYKTPNEGRA